MVNLIVNWSFNSFSSHLSTAPSTHDHNCLHVLRKWKGKIKCHESILSFLLRWFQTNNMLASRLNKFKADWVRGKWSYGSTSGAVLPMFRLHYKSALAWQRERVKRSFRIGTVPPRAWMAKLKETVCLPGFHYSFHRLMLPVHLLGNQGYETAKWFCRCPRRWWYIGNTGSPSLDAISPLPPSAHRSMWWWCYRRCWCSCGVWFGAKPKSAFFVTFDQRRISIRDISVAKRDRPDSYLGCVSN